MPIRKSASERFTRNAGTAALRLRRQRPSPCFGAAPHVAWAPASDDDAVQQVLQNTLRSACEVVGAYGGFAVVLRDDTVFEIARAHVLTSAEVLDLILGPAAGVLHRALVDRGRSLAGENGELLPDDAPTPALLGFSLELELGQHRRGALCLLRRDASRALRALDHEILEALAGQAALVLGAACQRRALRRLEASLRAPGLPPLP